MSIVGSCTCLGLFMSGWISCRVEIVAEAFEKKPLVQRHRQVYDLLKEELEPGKIHALTLKLKTPVEAQKEASKRTL